MKKIKNMKIKKLMYLSAFMFFWLLPAQTHRYIYELKYKLDSTQAEHSKRLMVLDINPKDTKYYDYNFLVKDSINKATNSQNTNWTNQIPISRKRNSNKNINYQIIEFQIYSYLTNDEIKWTLSNETQVYSELEIQKATANFGGRKWIAWFTKEIPFSEGPYKFQGLPGLIILLKDSQDQYIFSLAQNKNLKTTYDTSNFLEERYGNKPLFVTEKTFISKALEYFNDPYHGIRENLRNGNNTYEENGVKYSNANELVPLIKKEQNFILTHNNPIERSKAIKYSKK